MPRTKMLEEYKTYASLTEKEQQWIIENHTNFQELAPAIEAAAKPKKEGGGCANVKRVAILEDKAKLLNFPIVSMNDTPSMIAYNEEKYLGIAINCSVVDGCDISESNCTCKEFVSGRTGRLVLAVTIQAVRDITIKKGNNIGQKMAYLVVSDGTCSLSDVCVFPEVYKKYKDILSEGNNVLLQGEAGKKDGGFIVKTCSQI